jgi:tetratricopeptide (TPR) repeat protein
MARKNVPRPTPLPDRFEPEGKPLVVRLICLFLAALVWTVFAQTIGHDFVNYDDNEYVYENLDVKRGVSLGGIWWAFTHTYSANWHSLTTISHMLDCQLYGLQPWGHHLTNVCLHTLAAILLFLALRKLTLAVWPSAFAAAIFAIHPLHVESVAWVSERKDVLSGVFFMLTLLAYASYARDEERSLKRYVTVLVLFALGLLCKPTLVTLPFVLLLLDYWPLRRWQSVKSREQRTESSVARSLILEKIPLFILSITSCVATTSAQSEALEATKRLGFAERASNALISYFTYLGQLIYPRHLAVMYPYLTDVAVVSQLIPIFLLLALITIAFFLARKRYPFMLVGWLWFLGMMVPMIGFVQVGSQAHADRYTYLTQIGLYLLITWGAIELLGKSLRSRKVLSIFGLLIVTTLTAWSYRETSYWKNTETLWRHALANTSNNYIAHNNLGTVLTQHGQLPEAILHFHEAIRLKSDYAEAYNNLGNALLDSDETARRHKPQDPDHPESNATPNAVLDEAIEDYNKALEAKPGFAEAWANLGTAVLQKGHLEEAITHYRKALELAPDLPEASGNLGNALLEQGDIDESIARYSKAIELKPDYADAHYGISMALLKKNRPQEAMTHVRKVIALKPDYPEAHHNMGVILAQQGNLDSAIDQYQQAIQLKPDYAQAENNLANALLRKDKIDDAIAHLRNALKLEPNYAEPCNDLGSAFMQKGQLDDAITWYKKAIQLKQNYAEAHSNLGNAFFQKKDIDKAIAQYKAAVFFNPDSAPMQYNLGNALIAKGNRTEAITCYQTALRVEPGYSAAKQQLRKLGVPVSD